MHYYYVVWQEDVKTLCEACVVTSTMSPSGFEDHARRIIFRGKSFAFEEISEERFREMYRCLPVHYYQYRYQIKSMDESPGRWYEGMSPSTLPMPYFERYLLCDTFRCEDTRVTEISQGDYYDHLLYDSLAHLLTN